MATLKVAALRKFRKGKRYIECNFKGKGNQFNFNVTVFDNDESIETIYDDLNKTVSLTFGINNPNIKNELSELLEENVTWIGDRYYVFNNFKHYSYVQKCKKIYDKENKKEMTEQEKEIMKYKKDLIKLFPKKRKMIANARIRLSDNFDSKAMQTLIYFLKHPEIRAVKITYSLPTAEFCEDILWDEIIVHRMKHFNYCFTRKEEK